MGIFSKFKLTEVLSTFCYLANIISINIKVVKYFANSINYDNSLKNITLYREIK